MRASDPIFEVGLTMGGHQQEDRFWDAHAAQRSPRTSASPTPRSTRRSSASTAAASGRAGRTCGTRRRSARRSTRSARRCGWCAAVEVAAGLRRVPRAGARRSSRESGGQPGMRMSTGRTASRAPTSSWRVAEHAAAQRAVAERRDEAWLGHRVVGGSQRGRHPRRDRSGDEQDVGVSRRRDDIEAEPLEVVARRSCERRARARSRCTSRRRRGAARASAVAGRGPGGRLGGSGASWRRRTNISGPRRRSRARSSC